MSIKLFYFMCTAFIVFIFFEPAHAKNDEIIIGSKYFIEKPDNVIFHKDKNMNNPFTSETRQYFQIKSVDENTAHIILEDGIECFFEINRLNRYINEKKLAVYTRQISLDRIKDEFDELNNKAKKNDIISKLESVGISKGKTLWLRHAYLDKIKSLEKVNILDVDYDDESIILKIKYLNYELNINFPEDINSVKNYFYDFNPLNKWSAIIVNAINNHKILLGMTNDQIVSSWGYPDEINRSAGSWGIHEQWIYGHSYLYLENGKLKSWQD